MKASLTSFFLFTLFVWHTSIAQNNGSDIIWGKHISITSEVLENERKLQVFLPEGYESSNISYPVLYLLDGQDWSTYALSIHNLLSGYKYIPQFIIVGINTDDNPRFRFFSNSGKLIRFLEQDVVSFIDKTYRTSNKRILFGWQFAGAFVIELMAKKPDLFSTFFAASPIPLNKQRLDGVKKLVSNNDELDKTLFFTTSLNENGVEPGARQLAAILKKNAPDSFQWDYQVMKNETIVSFGHRTTPLGTLYQGLRKHYADYPMLEFNTLSDYESAGGYDYVQNYYQKRASKYGLSQSIPQEGMFFLARLGLDSDHYPTFERFMKDFLKTDFLDNINLGWSSRYAEFYLKHNDPDGAKVIYEKLIKRFPDNARPVNGLGDVFRTQGQIVKAEEQYKKAISIAEKTKDNRLQDYIEDLNSLKKKQ